MTFMLIPQRSCHSPEMILMKRSARWRAESKHDLSYKRTGHVSFTDGPILWRGVDQNPQGIGIGVSPFLGRPDVGVLADLIPADHAPAVRVRRHVAAPDPLHS